MRLVVGQSACGRFCARERAANGIRKRRFNGTMQPYIRNQDNERDHEQEQDHEQESAAGDRLTLFRDGDVGCLTQDFALRDLEALRDRVEPDDFGLGECRLATRSIAVDPVYVVNLLA
jgi:hypothetical protein